MKIKGRKCPYCGEKLNYAIMRDKMDNLVKFHCVCGYWICFDKVPHECVICYPLDEE